MKLKKLFAIIGLLLSIAILYNLFIYKFGEFRTATLKGNVLDNVTLEPLANVSIIIEKWKRNGIEEDSKNEYNILTDSLGNYEIKIKNFDYVTISLEKEKYYPIGLSFETYNSFKKFQTFRLKKYEINPNLIAVINNGNTENANQLSNLKISIYYKNDIPVLKNIVGYSFTQKMQSNKLEDCDVWLNSDGNNFENIKIYTKKDNFIYSSNNHNSINTFSGYENLIIGTKYFLPFSNDEEVVFIASRKNFNAKLIRSGIFSVRELPNDDTSSITLYDKIIEHTYVFNLFLIPFNENNFSYFPDNKNAELLEGLDFRY